MLQCRAEALGDVFDPRLRVGTGNVEVAVRGQLLEGTDLAAVGRAPPEHHPDLVDLVAEAPREDEAVEPEAGQDLGQLERMAEAVRHVTDRRGLRAEPPAHGAAHEQVADQRLGPDEQLVGQHITRPDLEPSVF